MALAVWLLVDDRSVFRNDAEQATSNHVLSLAQSVERNVLHYDFALREAAAELAVAEPGSAGPRSDARVEAALARAAPSMPNQFGAILAIDASNRIVRHGSLPLQAPMPRSSRVAELDLLRKHQDDPGLGLLITGPLPTEDGSGWYIVLSRRATRADDSFAGVVAGTVRLDFFTRLFEASRLGNGGLAGLLRDDGTVLAHWPAALNVVGKNLRDEALFRYLEKAPAGIFDGTFMLDGVQRQYAYQKVGGLPFVISVGQSYDAIYAPWEWKAALVGGILLALVAVAAGLLLALRRELNRRDRADQSARSAGQAARASAAELRTLFDNMQDGLLVLRAAATECYVCDRLNRPAEAILGVAADQVIGRLLEDAWPGRHARHVGEQVRRCARSGQATTFELQQETAGGGTRELRVTFVPVSIDGGGAGAVPARLGAEPSSAAERVLGTVQDMTERTRLETQLRQAQKMEAVGRLTAGVAHDFNNLLQTVLGSLELLEESSALDEQTREFAQLASQAARRGATLTHQLLAFSRQQVLRSRPVDLDLLLSSLRGLLVRTLGTGIDVIVEIEPGTWPVLVDAAQLDSCLLTLAINARDAMPEGGRLRLRARNAPVRHDKLALPNLPPDRDFVEIRIEDTGAGMSADVLERAFDPFFTTKPLGHGSGLGLSVVQGFVGQSGGAVRLESVPGHGTAATLWLPRAPVGQDPPTPRSRSVRAMQRVLLVDDEPEVRRSLALMLNSAGFEVQSAGSGTEALDLLHAASEGRDQAGRTATFDVLLADQTMPDMTGTELVRAALGVRPTLPALIITGSDQASAIGELPQHVQVLYKPVARAALVAAIDRASLLAGAPGEASEHSSRADAIPLN